MAHLLQRIFRHTGLHRAKAPVTLPAGVSPAMFSAAGSAAVSWNPGPTAAGSFGATGEATTQWISPATGRDLLTAADFTYLGRYTLLDNGLSVWGSLMHYGRGLTYRIVGGQLRLLTLAGPDSAYPIELNIEGVPYGTTLTNTHVANWWNNNWYFGTVPGAVYCGLWWEDTGGGTHRLWTNTAVDYPGDPNWFNTRTISTRVLVGGSPGTVTTERGLWGLEQVGRRAHYGGVRKVPTWFQSAYSTGPYVSGFGGYSSQVAQGYTPSQGPFWCAIPDPHTFSDNTDIPSAQRRIMADYRAQVTSELGRRAGPVFDWFCSDGRENPPTRPTWPTDYSPDPGCSANPDAFGNPQPQADGFYRAVLGDSYYYTGNWIDNDAGTRSKHGVIAVHSGNSGYAWYQSGSLTSDYYLASLHIFDPADLAAVLIGTKSPWEVYPAATVNLSPYLVGRGDEQFAPDTLWAPSSPYDVSHHSGACFVAERNLLFLVRHWSAGGTEAGGGTFETYIDAFSVAGG